jgi:hypothetical protein
MVKRLWFFDNAAPIPRNSLAYCRNTIHNGSFIKKRPAAGYARVLLLVTTVKVSALLWRHVASVLLNLYI